MNWLPDGDILRQVPNFRPAVALAIVFPLVIVALTEAIAAGERRAWPLTRTLRAVRSLVMPSLAAYAFATAVLGMPEESTAVRIVETLLWTAVLVTVSRGLNDVFFGLASPDSWQERMPTLFRDLARAALVAAGCLIVYAKVWGQDVGGALTALGVGSVVIGLALQEPLGNLVSGLMLLFERPLQVGDWVTAGGVTGKVTGINWRSVHIATPTREIHVVPNVSLYKSEFSNLSLPTPVRTDSFELGLGYDNPPDDAKRILFDMLATTPGVLSDPPPIVRCVAYADWSVTYRLSFSVASQEHLAATRDHVMTRIWYVVRREGLTIPYPIQMEFSPGESPSPPPPDADALLAAHPRFRPGIPAAQAAKPVVLEYAAGETVHSARRRFAGFGLVLSGRAALLVADKAGQPVQIGTIGPGECLGDKLAVGSARDDIDIVAEPGLQIVKLDPDAVGDLLDRSPTLAAEIGNALEARRQAANAAAQAL